MNKNDWLLTDPNTLISLEKWQKTVNLLAKLFNAPASFVVQYTPKGFQVTLASEQSENPYAAGTIIESDVNIFCSKIVKTRQHLYVADAPLDPCWDTNPEVHDDGFRSYLGVPVMWPDGSPFGTFCVMDFKSTAYAQDYFDLIHQLRDILEADLTLSAIYEEIRLMAMTDSLTSLYNRRGFTSVASQRIALAKRLNSKLGLLYMDIDQFKLVNDQHGHTTGDAVIKGVAESMRHSMRSTDVLGRLGGDEFVAIVMFEQQSDILTIQQRFDSAISDYIGEHDLPTFVVSCGYALIDPHNYSLDELLHTADMDMYKHKSSK